MSTSATDLTTALRDGRISAETVMAACYDAIEAWNPHVNALVSLRDREDTLALARRADAAETRGPLQGVPMAIKDLSDAEGFVTTQGSPLLADGPPAAADDLMVARLRSARALIIGKTNTPEFGMGSHTTNPVFGATRNPWSLSHTPGGSSGGASVALSTGMLALADGSDMMGSLRNPAGWGNVYGLRPSWGAVPAEPRADTFLHQLSTAGPMARSPQDIGLLLSVMAGPDPRQPHHTALDPPAPARPLRIGWLGDWGGAFPMEAGILMLCEAALGTFSDLGHAVAPAEPGFDAEALWESWTVLRAWQMTASLQTVLAMPGAEARLGANIRHEIETGRGLTGMQVHDASVLRSRWFARAQRLFETWDVLALPTAQVWPFDVACDYPREIAGTPMDTYHRWMHVMVPASLIGLPALGVPAGFGQDGPGAGLPMGLQLIGPRGSDYGLLALGQGYHDVAPWTGRQPELPRTGQA